MASLASHYTQRWLPELRTGSKSILIDVITRDVVCPAEVKVDQSNDCLINDSQAVVAAIGKPAGATTFGNQADATKTGIRKNRSRKARPIRKIVDDRTVPLPQNWNEFIAVSVGNANYKLL